MFKTEFADGERVVLESLFPGIDIASGAIDLFTHVLNHAEKHRNKMTVTRLFCHTAMVVSFSEISDTYQFNKYDLLISDVHITSTISCECRLVTW